MDMSVSSNPAPAAPTPASPMLVNCVAYGKDGRKLGDVVLDDISNVLQYPDQFIWVGLHEPDEALLGKLRETLSRLPEKPRMMVILRYQEELGPAEIAELLRIPCYCKACLDLGL